MKQHIFLYAVLSLFTVTTAAGCDERSDSPIPDNAIRVETAEVTAITSDNAISGGRIIGETQAVKEFGICWTTTDNPIVSDNHNVGAGDASSFACYATGLSANMLRLPPERFTVSLASLRRLPVRMTIHLLPVGMTSRIRWHQPSICGRKAIWRRLRTTREVKALIKTRHRSALI